MNKKLSRIAAIALSAAMVTSAFAMSTSSAFAAATPTITPTAITYNAVGGDTSNTIPLATLFATPTATVKVGNVTAAAPSAVTMDANSYKITSGSALASTDQTDLIVSGKTAGTVTITGTGTVAPTSVEAGSHSKKYDVNSAKVTVTATVNVYKEGTAYVLPEKIGTGSAITYDETSNIAKAQSTDVGFNDSVEFQVFKAKKDTASAKATFVSVNDTAAFTSSNANVDTKTVAAGIVTVPAQTADDVHIGSAVISAAGAQSAALNVKDYFDYTAGTVEVKSTYGQPTKTVIGSYDVTGKDIHTDAALTIAAKGANVGTVSGTGAVTVNAGTVKAITSTGAVTISAATKDLGDITVGDVTNTTGAVAVTGAAEAAKNTDGTYSAVRVGNITTTSGAIDLTTTETAAKGAAGIATVGDIKTTTGAVSVTTTNDVLNTLKVGKISGVQGNFADCPYGAKFTLVDGKFTTGDLQYVGAVTVTAGKLTTGAISTGTVQTPSAFGNGCATTSTGLITVTAGELSASSINTQKVPTGAGQITVPANSFVIADTVEADYATPTSLTLYVPNATKGSVLYTTAVNGDSLFTIPGITAVEGKDSGKNIYTYTAKDVQFLGFTMNQSSVEVGKDASTTLNVTTIPQMALPTGYTIQWTADKDSVKLTPSADTLSCTVTSTGYTAENVNEKNDVTVTAILLKNGVPNAPFGSDKATGTCAVKLTGEVAPVLTTTVTDLDGKTTTVTADKVIKMTQSTYNTVDFSADKAGISEAALAFHTGNDKVAQTGTYTKWNGTAGKYNVYANGAVGSKVGVFANGVKVFQIEIVDRPFKCDTTLDLDGVKGKALTVGQKYSFKITPADGTKIDTFTFLTANDSAVASWGFVKNADGTVTATIKALKATDKIGVYAKINGVTYKVFAAAVK